MALPKGLPSIGRLLTEQPFANDSSTERSGVPTDLSDTSPRDSLGLFAIVAEVVYC